MTSVHPNSLNDVRHAHPPIDRLGALASSACAVHCVLGAVLPEALAAFGLGALFGHEAEWSLTLAAIFFAATALILGFRKHRSRLVVSLLAAGIATLVLARLLEESAGETFGIALSLLAGVVLVAGHLLNIRASRRGNRLSA